MVKILAMGDFHGKFPAKLKKLAKSKEIDLILCTGDLGGSKKLLKIIFKYFKQKWWTKISGKTAKKLVLEDYDKGKKIINELNSLNKKIYMIAGNWDFTTKGNIDRTMGLKLVSYSKLMKKKQNLIFTNRTFRRLKDLKILFFGGIVTAGVYTEGVFDKKETLKYKKKNKKETEHLMKYSNKNPEILFAHYPPYGFFDIVKFKGENPMNGKHIGFKGYIKFIKKNKPALFICGHMHEYQGKKKLGETLIITTGSAQEGKAAIIDFDEKKKKVKSVKFVK